MKPKGDLPLTELTSSDQENDRKYQLKMDKRVIIAVVISLAVVLILGLGIGLGVNWSKNNEDDGRNLIKGKVTNYEKIQNATIGKDYYKFVPEWKSGDGMDITFETFIDSIGTNQDFLDDFINILKNGTDFDEYFFECPPITKSTLNSEKFEFVLKKATRLANRVPDFEKFETHFSSCPDEGDRSVDFISGFKKDQYLVCPCPPPPENSDDHTKYVHLAIFVKEAPKNEIDAVFKRSVKVLKEKLNSSDNKQKWYLSTDGKGDAWLHVRISETPRLYKYEPYKSD